MLKRTTEVQSQIEMVTLNELVNEDHLLRKIDKAVDFSFIFEATDKYYTSERGRPAISPVVMFKVLFIGIIFGIRSERELVRQIQDNVAYRCSQRSRTWLLLYRASHRRR